jgi:hypothetical protein
MLIAALLFGCSPLPTTQAVRVSDVTLFGDMECLRIETPAATYYYGKRGAGFASIVDPDGHDWVSYRPGGKARGEYRGLPKCGQPVKYFHCGYGFGQYTNNNPFTTTFERIAPGLVRVHSETKDGAATCDWDFFPMHATLTLRRCGTNAFWFLYEGAPGGELNASKDFVVRPDGTRTPLSEPWESEAPWVLFGSSKSPWGFWMANHAVTVTATYVSWPYKPEPDGGLNQMTVFGWGRLGWQDPQQHTPQLHGLPAKFSIGFVKGTKVEDTKHAASRALK